jgi:alcohol dehydrogenase YqhD (iron-dependent ADH family)
VFFGFVCGVLYYLFFIYCLSLFITITCVCFPGLAVISLQYYPFLYNKFSSNPNITSQFLEWAERVFGVSSVEEGFAKFREMYILWKAPLSLKDLGIPKEDIEKLLGMLIQKKKKKKR